MYIYICIYTIYIYSPANLSRNNRKGHLYGSGYNPHPNAGVQLLCHWSPFK